MSAKRSIWCGWTNYTSSCAESIDWVTLVIQTTRVTTLLSAVRAKLGGRTYCSNKEYEYFNSVSNVKAYYCTHIIAIKIYGHTLYASCSLFASRTFVHTCAIHVTSFTITDARTRGITLSSIQARRTYCEQTMVSFQTWGKFVHITWTDWAGAWIYGSVAQSHTCKSTSGKQEIEPARYYQHFTPKVMQRSFLMLMLHYWWNM